MMPRLVTRRRLPVAAALAACATVVPLGLLLPAPVRDFLLAHPLVVARALAQAAFGYRVPPSYTYQLGSDEMGASPSHEGTFEITAGDLETGRAVLGWPPEFGFAGFLALGPAHTRIGEYALDVDRDGVANFTVPLRALDAETAYADLRDDGQQSVGDPVIVHAGSHTFTVGVPLGGDGTWRTIVASLAARGTVRLLPGLLTNPLAPGDYTVTGTFTSIDPDTGGVDDGKGSAPQGFSLEASVRIGPPACAFFVRSEALLGKGSRADGDVGASDPGGHVRLGKRARMADGTRVLANRVTLDARASAFDVAAATLERHRKAEVRGSASTTVPAVTGSLCALPPATCGADAVSVPRRGSQTLGPGTYGAVEVGAGGTLSLLPGSYVFCSLTLGRKATLLGAQASTSVLHVSGDVRLAQASRIGGAGGPLPVLQSDGALVTLGAGAAIEGFVSAPAARLAFAPGSRLRGAACAGAIAAPRGVRLECAP